MARFEQAVLARTFFEPESLRVSESESDPQSIDGWCLSFAPSGQPDDGLIGCICLANQASSGTGDQLLQSAEQWMSLRGIESIRVGIVQDNRYGLAGLSPIGYGIGVPENDTRLAALLAARGYRGSDSFHRMTATVTGYRPPVSRDAIQLRRTTQIDMVDFSHADDRASAAMSHLDVEMHRLIDRSSNVLARANLWFSDPEAEVMNPAMAIFDSSALESADRLSPAESYLIGTAIQSLVARGIAAVETVVDADSETLISQMKTLHFTAVERGEVWSKHL